MLIVFRASLGSCFVVAIAACAAPPAEESVAQASDGERCAWTQWGGSAGHDGAACARGQALATERAHVVLDPFVDQEVAESARGGIEGPLLVHYQVPLIAGDDVFVMHKDGTFVSCDPPGSGTPAPCGSAARDQQVWTERAYRWHRGRLELRWAFSSDWKPPALLNEEQFQPALAGRFLYVPGAGGSVFKIDAHDGHLVKRIAPLGTTLDAQTFVWGGIAADRRGNIYYNVVALGAADSDVRGAWLVKVDERDRASKVDYTTLIPGAPAPTDLCFKTFTRSVPRPARPYPPPPGLDGSPALPDRGPCGSQAPGLGVTPAIGRDGTIFTATRAQLSVNGASFVAALRPNLTLKWAASLSGLLNDGCGVKASFCRDGATVGVDPETNLPPEARVSDASSSSPVALPDGSVAYGALTIYNGGRGHLMRFDAAGHFTGSFDFGWDVTPAAYEHDGTYSIVIKDNGYDEGDFRISQIDANLAVEWSYHATNPLSCERLPDGTVQCTDTGDSPTGFEWCLNAPVVDRNGTVYGTNEDGNVYAIGQGGVETGRFFLDRTRGAVYTPAAIDARGRIYALNNGELFVVGR